MCNNSLQVCCQLVSACYTAGGELERLTLKCCAFSQLFTTIVSNQEESSVLVQAFDALHTLAENGMYQFTSTVTVACQTSVSMNCYVLISMKKFASGNVGWKKLYCHAN